MQNKKISTTISCFLLQYPAVLTIIQVININAKLCKGYSDMSSWKRCSPKIRSHENSKSREISLKNMQNPPYCHISAVRARALPVP